MQTREMSGELTEYELLSALKSTPNGKCTDCDVYGRILQGVLDRH